MLAGGIDSTRTNLDSSRDAVDIAKQLIELESSGANEQQLNTLKQQLADALKQPAFEIKRILPVFLQVVKKIDAANVYQQFHLPGRDIVVVDRRESSKGKPLEPAKESSKDAAKKTEDKRETKADQDRLKESAAKETTGKEKAGSVQRQAAMGLEQRVAGERLEKMLTAFEKMVLARFENGRPIGPASADGMPKFLAKTDAQWKDFFKAFLGRTTARKTALTSIRDFLFRGLVSKGEKGIFIGDLRLADGRVEKFARFLLLADALAKLKKLSPGEFLNARQLGELTGEDLVYLALAASRGPEVKYSQKPTQGMFVGERAEQNAAAALGLPFSQQLKQKAKMLKRGGLGLGGSLFGEGEPENVPYQFIPWWHWGNLTRPSKFKWVTAAFYGTMLALAIIGIALMTWRLMN